MNTNTLIISPSYVKENNIIDANVEDKKITSIIKRAQDRYIWTSLSSNLYEKILSDITASTLTGNYLTLVDSYIIPCLLEYSVYELVPYIHYGLTNKSIEVKSGINQKPVGKEDVIYLRDNIKSMAEFYEKRLGDYLCNNTSLFPELSTNQGANLQPKTKPYKSSIYTPRPSNDRIGGDVIYLP